MVHYHVERDHQGLDNALVESEDYAGMTAGEVQCREDICKTSCGTTSSEIIFSQWSGYVQLGRTRVCPGNL